jgi:septal ring factor EnvC (AmiA/AmiB activator)
MQRFGLVLLGCVCFSNIWAQSSPDTSKQAEKISQQVAQHQSEVQRLQQDLNQQESASQQAEEKLQQQDRAIVELRKQLQAAKEASKPQEAGH